MSREKPARLAGHVRIAGKLRPVYRWTVRVTMNSSYHCTTVAEWDVTVLSCTAAEAIDSIRDELGWPAETEYDTWGPKGGATHRYTGWETSIAMQMAMARSPVQGVLNYHQEMTNG